MGVWFAENYMVIAGLLSALVIYYFYDKQGKIDKKVIRISVTILTVALIGSAFFRAKQDNASAYKIIPPVLSDVKEKETLHK